MTYTCTMEHTSSATALSAATALSEHVDAVMAAEQAVEEVASRLGRIAIDLALVFTGGEHAQEMAAIAGVVRSALRPAMLLGVTAGGVVGNGVEVEDKPGVALFAAALPGTTLHAFTYRHLPHVKDEHDEEALLRMAAAIGARSDLRATLFFADPFSVPAGSIVGAISAVPKVVRGLPRLPLVGGMASAGAAPGSNMLVLNDEVMRSGAVGVTIRGNVAVDCMVSQGCRPIGRPLVITGGHRNIITALGGRSAFEVLRDTVNELDETDRLLLPNGIFIGRVINEYKDRFGRGDFLVRGVMGVDQSVGAVAVGDAVQVGQTVQFHVRDAETASEDLTMLLEAEQLRRPAVGALLFTCNGRGRKFFSKPNHDAQAICAALDAARAEGSEWDWGASDVNATSPVEDRVQDAPGDAAPSTDSVPLAGFFAAGEIGPIGDRSFVHGHTAIAAIFRGRDD